MATQIVTRLILIKYQHKLFDLKPRCKYCNEMGFVSDIAAAPKQIGELMQADGLTNDGVKRHLQICGSTWHTTAFEGNGTIALSNIDKKWNNENVSHRLISNLNQFSGLVLSLLQKVGITKIDEVSVVPDPENTELNRGFAFIEFETKSDAQMAYRKLQIKNVFGEYSKIKVAWAESLPDPVEEETRNLTYCKTNDTWYSSPDFLDVFVVFGIVSRRWTSLFLCLSPFFLRFRPGADNEDGWESRKNPKAEEAVQQRDWGADTQESNAE
ncbi:Nucleotide-binding, alpha-beta plait [Artemisia annua]|uniref:Nucleotide-binding, alpha-beta plait n=1 Tax=Artemisia annua TaxID=35608 RepID=A0A2U1LTK5_ARTAN|nr:Nucleotide-binding, alpha-beta plait [Artemisia annua]